MKKTIRLIVNLVLSCKKLTYFQSNRNENFSICIAFKNKVILKRWNFLK